MKDEKEKDKKDNITGIIIVILIVAIAILGCWWLTDEDEPDLEQVPIVQTNLVD